MVVEEEKKSIPKVVELNDIATSILVQQLTKLHHFVHSDLEEIDGPHLYIPKYEGPLCRIDLDECYITKTGEELEAQVPLDALFDSLTLKLNRTLAPEQEMEWTVLVQAYQPEDQRHQLTSVQIVPTAILSDLNQGNKPTQVGIIPENLTDDLYAQIVLLYDLTTGGDGVSELYPGSLQSSVWNQFNQFGGNAVSLRFGSSVSEDSKLQVVKKGHHITFGLYPNVSGRLGEEGGKLETQFELSVAHFLRQKRIAVEVPQS